ncbi:MAG: FAD-binding oxidoreductase [Alteromonadaceae bacterium]|nr:MAG: FAD-binding oxidoreductase [Alteromonadaceae bacterium]
MIPRLEHLSPTQTRYLTFLQALEKRPFKGDICPDYANRTVLATDNSIYQILPQGVIYPANTDDVVELCHLAAKKEFSDIVLSPRGGGTGTNGQSLTDGLVVDLSKYMNNIIDIDPQKRLVRVQTGVVKDQLNAALKPHGLFFAPELSTSNRATIGGMINTDASGQGSCLYGKTRDHVETLQTVLIDGSVLNTRAQSEDDFNAAIQQQDRGGLIHRLVNDIDREHHDLIEATFPKLNRCLTGYDLAHIRDEQGRFNLNNILCGSEGTLGMITEATLRVLPIPKCSALVIVKYADFNASLRDATELMKASPSSIETIDSKVLNLAMNDFIWHQVESFFDDNSDEVPQGVNLVEYSADDETTLQKNIDGLLALLDSAKNSARLGYSIAMGTASVNKIWAMRKRAVGLLGNAEGEARPIPFVEDTAVPPEKLADFILEFRAILDGYGLAYGMFGHVDAGVLHVRPALDMKDPEQEKIAWKISDQVAELTQKYHGLLWGEHGKGVRSEYSPKFFGALYPQLQRIKAAFDPNNQLNPGKIATPDKSLQLLKISEVTTRGQTDRLISSDSWKQFDDAVYCNGNGTCFNWNPNDSMCPSWKATRERVQSPKGRASLIREWLKLLSESNSKKINEHTASGFWPTLKEVPQKIINSIKKGQGAYDFSHEVYDSMAGCLACKSCAGQCPIKVNVPEFRSQFLELYHTRYLRPLKDYLVASLEYLLPWCAKLPRTYNLIMNLAPVTFLLKHLVGFVDGPKLSGLSFRKAGVILATPAILNALDEEQKRYTVVIVQDAFTSYFETQVVIDTCHYLRELGLNPLLAPYKANGKPMHVHGFLNRFRSAASANAKMLNQLANSGVALVGIDPSMTLTYRSEYAKYLVNEKAPRVQLIQEFLSDYFSWRPQAEQQAAAPESTLSPEPAATPASTEYTLLPHCTEKTNATQSMQQWQQVFAKSGLQLKILEAGCCGMSGTYGHEARNRENSKTIYAMSWQPHVKQQVTSQLLATGYSCRSQVKREDDTQLQHPVQALLAAITAIKNRQPLNK